MRERYEQMRAALAAAADGGDAAAAFELALLLLGGGGDDDRAAGLARLARAAEAVPAAAAMLGGILLLDPARAAEGIGWLRRAAGAGEASAFWLLGAAHLRGLGVGVDARQARLLMAQAAEGGVVAAQLELARLYVDGVGGARDEAAAARWERAAAEAGSADGCLRVAERAASRPGGVALAIPWLERAADLGSAAAAERLADLYSMGREVARDQAAAERWRGRADALGRGREAK